VKITIDRAALLSVATQCAAVANVRASIPVLGNVCLLVAADGTLEGKATDLYQGVRARVACDVAEPGSCIANAKALKDLVSRLPDGAVTLSLDGSALAVEAGRSRYRLPTMPADDFPAMPEPSGDAVTLDGDLLASVLDAVMCAASDDDTRPHISGVLLEIEATTLRAVATDGHRLHLVQRAIEARELPSMLVPRKAVSTLRRLCTSDVTIATDRRSLFATAGGVELSAKLVEEVFPPYAKVIPKKHAHELHVDRDALREALKRLGCVSGSHHGVRLVLSEGKVTLASEDPDVGEGVEEIDCDATGALTISANARYLLDALGGADETATLSMLSKHDPITITGDGYVAVVMPLRT